MITLIWYSIKMIQIFALLAVLGGLYYGYTDHNMDYELRMFMYGGVVFYVSQWINDKFVK